MKTKVPPRIHCTFDHAEFDPEPRHVAIYANANNYNIRMILWPAQIAALKAVIAEMERPEQCQPAKPELVANADPFLREEDLSALGISPEQAANFDRLIVEQDTIAREDAAWLEAEQRS